MTAPAPPMPTLLAISTSSAALSVAVFRGAAVGAAVHEVIGRGHAERLVATVAAVLAEAGMTRADAILVDLGPGSFTGVRIGVAAARALGLAWGVPVTGVTATSLVAAGCFAADPGADACTVLIDAGRGQFYRQRVTRDFAPAAVIDTVTGTGTALGTPGTPDARLALAVPPAARALVPSPLYVAPPNAVLPL